MSDREWRCPVCGEWVDCGFSAHPHRVAKPASRADMVAFRRAAEAGLVAANPIDDESEAGVTYFRNFQEEERIKQCPK